MGSLKNRLPFPQLCSLIFHEKLSVFSTQQVKCLPNLHNLIGILICYSLLVLSLFPVLVTCLVLYQVCLQAPLVKPSLASFVLTRLEHSRGSTIIAGLRLSNTIFTLFLTQLLILNFPLQLIFWLMAQISRNTRCHFCQYY